ncbi:MAG: PadR family transcriptional regulator [Intrasporangium sp.]|nr:PadR family transcriptional regulator [Intrasporangium sp.]
MSGYELKKVIDASVGHFWSADQSQIYRTLNALVEDGMASRTTVAQDDRPNLHLHDITLSGEAALEAWLESPLDPEVTREPFLARVFFADRLPIPGIVALLEARWNDVSRTLASLEAVEAPVQNHSTTQMLRTATLENGIAHARTELEWIESVLRRLNAYTS